MSFGATPFSGRTPATFVPFSGPGSTMAGMAPASPQQGMGDALATISNGGGPSPQRGLGDAITPQRGLGDALAALSNGSIEHGSTDFDTLCPVCLQHRNMVALVPCGHRLCEWCCGRILSTVPRRCPICRTTDIQSVRVATHLPQYLPVDQDVLHRLNVLASQPAPLAGSPDRATLERPRERFTRRLFSEFMDENDIRIEEEEEEEEEEPMRPRRPLRRTRRMVEEEEEEESSSSSSSSSEDEDAEEPPRRRLRFFEEDEEDVDPFALPTALRPTQVSLFDEGDEEDLSEPAPWAVPEYAAYTPEEMRALRPDVRLTPEEIAEARKSLEDVFANYPLSEALLWAMPVSYTTLLTRHHEGLTEQDKHQFAIQLAAQRRTGINDAFYKRLIPHKWVEMLSPAEAKMYAQRVGFRGSSDPKPWLLAQTVGAFVPLE